jgi:hypothetical protein
MDVAAILAALEAITQLYASIAPLIADVKAAMASNDQAGLDAALAKIQAANDALIAEG